MDSSTEITVQWDAPTQDCWANEYRVTVSATNLGQCGTAGDTTVGEWLDADLTAVNQVSLSALSPYTSYTITVTPGTTDTDNGEMIPGTSVSIQETTTPQGRYFAGLGIKGVLLNAYADVEVPITSIDCVRKPFVEPLIVVFKAEYMDHVMKLLEFHAWIDKMG